MSYNLWGDGDYAGSDDVISSLSTLLLVMTRTDGQCS